MSTVGLDIISESFQIVHSPSQKDGVQLQRNLAHSHSKHPSQYFRLLCTFKFADLRCFEVDGYWHVVWEGPSAADRHTDWWQFFCFWRDNPPPPPVGQGLLIHEVSRSHTTTQHSR